MNTIKWSISLLLLFVGAQTIKAQSTNEQMNLQLKNSLTFYSSFDNGFSAAFSEGDPNFYVAPRWQERGTVMTPYTGGDHIQVEKDEGRFGDAIWIESASEPVYFYRAEKNVNYSKENWEGTSSFWLRLSQDEDLAEGYSDPIQFTDSGWNDGALFVDFTTKSPRTFRFAFFPDREIWDPQQRNWGEVPVEERPMVEVEEEIFSRDQWVHIAFSYQNLNTGEKNGKVDCYINGEYYDTLSGRELTLIWDIESAAIWLGYNYTGYFDELALFNDALDADEIQYIYALSGGIEELLSE